MDIRSVVSMHWGSIKVMPGMDLLELHAAT
jgi:hypothetical protein